MTLATIDPSSAVAVTSYLEQAKTWLATAVENTGPEQIARAKAEIATAAEATKQMHLAQEIQDDAREMVRRAEFTLGKAIRKGQEDGLITSRGVNGPLSSYEREGRLVSGSDRGAGLDPNTISAKSLVASGEELHQIYAMSDGVTPEEFDAVLEEAKAEGNLSRANVVRKIKGDPAPAGIVTRDMRADLISNLAEQGWSSRQMPEKVGVTEETIRKIAREFDIEIPADKFVGRSRRLDHTQMVVQTVVALSNEVDALQYIDFAEVDFSEADEWVTSLNQSISKLRKFANRIKETTHVV